ncbi:hypothetical protein [Litorivivens sp.]|uniref:hypothetical protein n=1 Tax=Litorivivens sp. TaxID=2020868 RepID=UPI00356AB07D
MSDADESNAALKLLVVFVVLIALLGVAAFLAWPLAAEFAATQLTPGLGMRDAAVLSFFLTVVVMVVFAFAAGDGLIGELQFMLAGFFSFFLVMWLLIAWVF